jgi:hypothetical protein
MECEHIVPKTIKISLFSAHLPNCLFSKGFGEILILFWRSVMSPTRSVSDRLVLDVQRGDSHSGRRCQRSVWIWQNWTHRWQCLCIDPITHSQSRSSKPSIELFKVLIVTSDRKYIDIVTIKFIDDSIFLR